MTEVPPREERTAVSVLKVLYLLAVTAATFAVPSLSMMRPAQWYVVPGLLLLQVVLLWRCGIPVREVIRSATRLKWLFAVLLVCYAFLPGDDRRMAQDWHSIPVPFLGGAVAINIAGLSLAALMCLQILTVILASAVVRMSGRGTDLVDGLRALRMPLLFVHAMDQTLGQLGGLQRSGVAGGRGDGSGGGRARNPNGDESAAAPPGFFAIVRKMVGGDVAFFTQAIQGNLDRARQQVQRDNQGRLDERLAHDIAVITGIALVMVSLKMLKSLPGVAFASGHKTLLFYPLYILAARLTHTRWGGTTAGAVMGVIGFLQGDGRFGVLDVLRHLAPGFLIDLLMPIINRLPQSAWVYCGLGFLAAIARTTTEFAVVLLLGGRAEVYVFPAARLIPNLIAGTLSGFITVVVLRAFPPVLKTGVKHAPASERTVEGPPRDVSVMPETEPAVAAPSDTTANHPIEPRGFHD